MIYFDLICSQKCNFIIILYLINTSSFFTNLTQQLFDNLLRNQHENKQLNIQIGYCRSGLL